MPSLKYTYFDIEGGRGQAARLAMAIGGIEYVDDRIPPPEWPSHKENQPFHALPVLEIDGEAVTQSNSINRYLGKLAGLYPDDPLEALRCDESMDAVDDIVTRMVRTFWLPEDEKREAREALVEGLLAVYLGRMGAMLEERGGTWFADGRLTVADLVVFTWVRNLRSGILDHIPTDLVDRIAPNLLAHFQRVAAEPGVCAYYEKRGVTV